MTSRKAAFRRNGRRSRPSCRERPRRSQLRQKDRDARWTRTVKYTKAQAERRRRLRLDLSVPAFGYKNHIGIDRRHRLIRRWTVTDAARHDGALLPELIDRHNTAGVGRHRLSLTQANEVPHRPAAALADPPQKAKSQADAAPHRPGQCPQVRRCTFGVELAFPRQKGPMGLFIRTIGLARARTKIGLTNLIYNMQRMVWLAAQTAPT